MKPNPNAIPIPALLYTRVSTDKQDMQRQDYQLPIYCAHHNLKVIAQFSDPDTSGSNPFADRQGGRELLAELARRSVHGAIAVVTTDQDRIGRDILDIVATIRSIWKTGAIPHFACENGAMPRTPENEMIVGIKASTAQYERDKIKQRINSKLAAMRSAGELCGTPPYGFDAVETGAVTAKGVKVRRLQDNAAEQKHIRRMVELREAGWGFHSIAKELNRLNVPTKRGKGQLMKLRTEGRTGRKASVTDKFTSGKWQAGNVAGVLNNQTVKAWLAHRQPQLQAAA